MLLRREDTTEAHAALLLLSETALRLLVELKSRQEKGA